MVVEVQKRARSVPSSRWNSSDAGDTLYSPLFNMCNDGEDLH